MIDEYCGNPDCPYCFEDYEASLIAVNGLMSEEEWDESELGGEG